MIGLQPESPDSDRKRVTFNDDDIDDSKAAAINAASIFHLALHLPKKDRFRTIKGVLTRILSERG